MVSIHILYSEYIVFQYNVVSCNSNKNITRIAWNQFAAITWNSVLIKVNSYIEARLLYQLFLDEMAAILQTIFSHDDVIKWKHFPRYWPFVRGIHQSPVNSPHKGQWRGALMLTLICARINGSVYNREAGDLRRNRVHYDVMVMRCIFVNETLCTEVCS